MIYKYKTEGKRPKDFRNYQNLINLCKDLRDGKINPKEILKDQTNFKSDLGGIKKSKPKLKPIYQASVIQLAEKFFKLREKIFIF